MSVKNVERKVIKNDIFSKNFSVFIYFLNSKRILLFQHNGFKKSTNMSKHITTKFLRSTVVSTPLNSIDFHGSQKKSPKSKKKLCKLVHQIPKTNIWKIKPLTRKILKKLESKNFLTLMRLT